MPEHTMSSSSLMDAEQDEVEVTGEGEEEAGRYRKGTLEKENM